MSTFGAGGCRFESRPHHTKGVKNDDRIKGVVLGRLNKAGKYLLKVLLCHNNSSTELMSLSKSNVK